ncbi:hypothetical protein OJF2_13650 [Aquisphaera giovannonii]|uniref:Uncharacterized protein n=1 Tax=Aquisphaera giovannonii TaxID=406548 RepID=A0A5B9VZ07_9BACT|nr:hypothetical protein [Aquisphaera giovannonii]QEH32880.1 hypothetical protein OJF2_13650 [Aquisphaera giovannonii]
MNPARAVLLMSLALLPGDDRPLEPLGRFDAKLLPECSGIVRSRRHPGIYWVHNDSGNAPLLFAVRRDGSVVSSFRVAVPNVDWEDIAADGDGHLYLGDIGNNGGRLPVRVVYRLDEPDPGKAPEAPLRPTAASFYTFPQGGRFDAEGIFLDAPSGSAVVVSKRFDGKEAELYAIPFRPAAPLLRPASPGRLGTLPGFVEPATGADLDADQARLAVCSETVTRVYRRSGEAWALLAEVPYPPAPIEGVTWDGDDLLLVSEGRGIDRIAASTWRRGIH